MSFINYVASDIPIDEVGTAKTYTATDFAGQQLNLEPLFRILVVPTGVPTDDGTVTVTALSCYYINWN
jgi:hypothetical protein